MAEEWKVYQCCYTNAVSESGGTIRSGWEPVAVSPHMPQMLRETCRSLQNADIPHGSQSPEAKGEPPWFYEVIGGDTCVYVLRTRFGLGDRAGRGNNMFSFAYAFPVHAALLRSPGGFLSLDPSQFQTDQAAAEAWLESWDGTFASLKKTEEQEDFLSALHWDNKQYETVIQCVYTQMRVITDVKPLYIHYDGTEEHLRRMLRAIYAALPWYLRRSLKSSTFANVSSTAKNLVFTTKSGPDLKDLGWFLNPEDGETNILGPKARAAVERSPFLTCAARDGRPERFADYFQNLDRYASAMGDKTTSDESLLRLLDACYRVALSRPASGVPALDAPDLSPLSEKDLDDALYTALRCPVRSAALDDLTARILRELYKRGLGVSDACAPLLQNRLLDTASDALRTAASSRGGKGPLHGTGQAGDGKSRMDSPGQSGVGKARMDSPGQAGGGKARMDSPGQAGDGITLLKEIEQAKDENEFSNIIRQTEDRDIPALRQYFRQIVTRESCKFDDWQTLRRAALVLRHLCNQHLPEADQINYKSDFEKSALDYYSNTLWSKKIQPQDAFAEYVKLILLVFPHHSQEYHDWIVRAEKEGARVREQQQYGTPPVDSSHAGKQPDSAIICDGELHKSLTPPFNVSIAVRAWLKFLNSPHTEEEIEDARRYLLGTFIREDTAQHPLPLPMWLLLKWEENRFRIFDICVPRCFYSFDVNSVRNGIEEFNKNFQKENIWEQLQTYLNSGTVRNTVVWYVLSSVNNQRFPPQPYPYSPLSNMASPASYGQAAPPMSYGQAASSAPVQGT